MDRLGAKLKAVRGVRDYASGGVADELRQTYGKPKQPKPPDAPPPDDLGEQGETTADELRELLAKLDPEMLKKLLTNAR